MLLRLASDEDPRYLIAGKKMLCFYVLGVPHSLAVNSEIIKQLLDPKLAACIFVDFDFWLPPENESRISRLKNLNSST
jgi:hypothetical protein